MGGTAEGRLAGIILRPAKLSTPSWALWSPAEWRLMGILMIPCRPWGAANCETVGFCELLGGPAE
eukprot:4943305-Pyramimonas_sp.AAC.2